jgi:hypothetical protein
MMSRLRLTIGQTMAVVAYVAFGFAALRNAMRPINDLESDSINKTAARLVAGRITA